MYIPESFENQESKLNFIEHANYENRQLKEIIQELFKCSTEDTSAKVFNERVYDILIHCGDEALRSGIKVLIIDTLVDRHSKMQEHLLNLLK